MAQFIPYVNYAKMSLMATKMVSIFYWYVHTTTLLLLTRPLDPSGAVVTCVFYRVVTGSNAHGVDVMGIAIH